MAGQQRAADALFDEYIDLMRTHALSRTDTNRQAQNYALNAASGGFFVTEQFLPDQLQEMSLERKPAALADLVRLASEPPDEPDLDVPRAIAPQAIELLGRIAWNAN